MSSSTLERILANIQSGNLLEVSKALNEDSAQGLSDPKVWSMAARHLDHRGYGQMAQAIWRKQLSAGYLTVENVSTLVETWRRVRGDTRAMGLVDTFLSRQRDVTGLSAPTRVLFASLFIEHFPDRALALLEGLDHSDADTALLWIDANRNAGQLQRALALLDGQFAAYLTHDQRFQMRKARVLEALGQWDQALGMWRLLWQAGQQTACVNILRILWRLEHEHEHQDVTAKALIEVSDPELRIRIALSRGDYALAQAVVEDLVSRPPVGLRWPAAFGQSVERIRQELLSAGCLGLAVALEQWERRLDTAAVGRGGLEVALSRFALKQVSTLLGPASFGEKAQVRAWDVGADLVASGNAGLLEPITVLPPQPSDMILLVNAALGAGGAERQFLVMVQSLIAAGLAPSKLHIAFFSLAPDRGHAHFLPQLDQLGVGYTDLSKEPLLALEPQQSSFAPFLPNPLREDVFRLRRLASRLRPRVYHGWQDRAGLAAAWVGLEMGSDRILISARNMQPAKRRANLPYAKALLGAMARHPSVTLTVNSLSGAEDYREWLTLNAEQSVPLLNGIDATSLALVQPQTDGAEATKSAGIPPLVLGGVFRFAQNKRPLLWLEILQLVAKADVFDVRGVLLGNGPLKQVAIDTAKENGLADRIEWRETQSDPRKIYAGMSALLLASRVEGTPNVVLEAQASGLPVVTYDVGGSREAALSHDQNFVENDNLVLAEDTSAQEAADAIVQWWPRVANGSARDRRDKVLAAYGTQTLARHVLQLYDEEQAR